MPLTSTAQVQSRVWSGFSKRVPVYGNFPAATSNVFAVANAATPIRRGAWVQGPPSVLETGVSGGYLLTKVQIASSVAVQFSIYEMFEMGVQDVAVGGLFTDGVAAPNRLQGGGSATVLPLQPLIEVDTTLAPTSTRTIALNYTDMAGAAKVGVAAAFATGSLKWSSGFPLLQPGDVHIQDVTGCTLTSGSSPSGIVRIWGLSPIYEGLASPSGATPSCSPLNEGIVARVAAGAKVGVFIHTTVAAALMGSITWVGDTP